MPRHPRGVVVFAHGDGSSRLSPRSRTVAAALVQAGYAALLLDLPGGGDGGDRVGARLKRSAQALGAALDWIATQPRLQPLPVGVFGAGSGAAVALLALADGGHRVSALVMRGARLDLAEAALAKTVTPTLLIVGARDPFGLDINRAALEHLIGPCRLEVVAGAGRLFDEPGMIDEVAGRAVAWFRAWLTPAPAD